MGGVQVIPQPVLVSPDQRRTLVCVLTM